MPVLWDDAVVASEEQITLLKEGLLGISVHEMDELQSKQLVRQTLHELYKPAANFDPAEFVRASSQSRPALRYYTEWVEARFNWMISHTGFEIRHSAAFLLTYWAYQPEPEKEHASFMLFYYTAMLAAAMGGSNVVTVDGIVKAFKNGVPKIDELLDVWERLTAYTDRGRNSLLNHPTPWQNLRLVVTGDRSFDMLRQREKAE